MPAVAAGTVAGLFYLALGNEPILQITESVMESCLSTGVNFLWLPPLKIFVSIPGFHENKNKLSQHLTSGVGKVSERFETHPRQ